MSARVSIVILSHRPQLVGQAQVSARLQTVPVQIVTNEDADYWPEKLNDAVAASRGEFFVVLCDDDKLKPTYVERTLAEADRTGADMVYTDVEIIGTRISAPPPIGLGRPVYWQLPEFDAEVLRNACTPWVTALVRKSLWFELGGFDGAQPHFDWDFWIRCAHRAPKGIVARHLKREFLYQYRDHAGNGSRVMDDGEAMRLLRAKHSVGNRALAPNAMERSELVPEVAGPHITAASA